MILIPVGVGYAAWWLTDFRRQQSKLPQLLERARRLGCATTAEEFGAVMAPVTECENAAAEYREFQAELDRLEETEPDAYKVALGATLGIPQMTPEVGPALSKAAHALSILERAAEKPFHRVNHLAEDPPKFVDDTARTMRAASKLLCLHILYSNQEGAGDELDRWMDVLRRVIEHCHYQPTQLSWIVQVSAINRCLWTSRQIVKGSDQHPGLLDWVQVRLDGCPRPAPLLPCIKAEAAYALAYGKEMKRIGIPAAWDGQLPFYMRLGYWQSPQAIDAAVAVEVGKLVNSVEAWPEDERDAYRVAVATMPSWREGKWWLSPSYCWPAMHQGVGRTLVMLENQMKVTYAGLSLYQFRVAHGRFPKSADEANLGPEFIYFPTGETFRLQIEKVVF